MELLRISINNLFGQFNYNIELNQEEGITILTGPNGYGKTTILNIIWSLFNQKFNVLQKIKLENVSLLFTNGMSLVFTIKKEQGQAASIRQSITVLEAEVFLNDEKIDFEKHECAQSNSGNSIKFKEKIIELLRSQTVYLIKDQRLTYAATAKYDGTFKYDGKIKHNGVAVLNWIETFSKNLTELMSQKKDEEDTFALSLADTFPERLLKYNQPLTQAVFEERFKRLSEKQQCLKKYGMNPGVFTKSEYESENKRILSAYLEDYEQKTALYDELLGKIELFLSILNGKKLVNKTVAVNVEKGFHFISSDGNPLPLAALSSGEQNETILLYELLFNASPHSLVLIDEPETSMHVAWQIEFLHDIEEIAKSSKLSFIIATHSPDLINDKMDLCVDLFENARRNSNHGE
jgi:predicted ATP-binding protein involved in virulence